MKTERLERFKSVVNRRQGNITVVLENVHDMHNIGAVMRTCDSVGIFEVYVLQTNPKIQYSQLILGKRTSAGTRKWVDVHYFTDAKACFTALRKKYDLILATHLDADSESIYDLDLTASVALLFGNEKDGVSREVLDLCDGNFNIPQVGMVQSLNISVACAVTLYEAFRQRQEKKFYTNNNTLSTDSKQELLDLYLERHGETYFSKHRIDPQT